jgi:two-component system nitrate/nitrite response regulator NarL
MAERGPSGASHRPHRAEVSVSRHPDSRLQGVARVRLIIASPVRLVREGLVATLHDRDGITVVDAVGMDAPGIARIIATEPDVVLVDLGQASPVVAARVLRAASPEAKLVAFALDENDTDVFACAAAGFSSYIPRESSADELHRALVDALDGRMHCAPHIAAAMFRRLADLLHVNGTGPVLPSLTSRESEILTLTEEGCSNKEIARRLKISSATVKNHMHNILQKLQVTRRGQAVARLRAGVGAGSFQ